jgi:hypothetical protein
MKFDHRHYVPILKGKRAEFPALGALESKQALTPLIEAVPSFVKVIIPNIIVGNVAQLPRRSCYAGYIQ